MGAFDTWYEQTRPTLVRSLLLVTGGNVDVATEAVDEAMVRAYERWDRVGAMQSPDGWVYRVALNLVRRRFRRTTTEARAVHRLGAGAPSAAPGADTSEALVLWEAVASLDRRTRTIVALRYVAGLREPEIAELLGTRTGTVSSTLSRARARLRAELDEDGAR